MGPFNERFEGFTRIKKFHEESTEFWVSVDQFSGQLRRIGGEIGGGLTGQATVQSKR